MASLLGWQLANGSWLLRSARPHQTAPPRRDPAALASHFPPAGTGGSSGAWSWLLTFI